jgi:hypothetical protein
MQARLRVRHACTGATWRSTTQAVCCKRLPSPAGFSRLPPREFRVAMGIAFRWNSPHPAGQRRRQPSLPGFPVSPAAQTHCQPAGLSLVCRREHRRPRDHDFLASPANRRGRQRLRLGSPGRFCLLNRTTNAHEPTRMPAGTRPAGCFSLACARRVEAG